VGDQPAIKLTAAPGAKGCGEGAVRSLGTCAGLPPRIQTLVDAELQRADILGAWVVFAVAAFLGSLHLAAPKALDSMGTLYTVPAIVGFILLLSLVRLRMAYRAPLGRTAQIGLHRGRFGDRLRHRVDGLLVAALRLGKISEVLALHPLISAL